jgi:hypothetical protein
MLHREASHDRHIGVAVTDWRRCRDMRPASSGGDRPEEVNVGTDYDKTGHDSGCEKDPPAPSTWDCLLMELAAVTEAKTRLDAAKGAVQPLREALAGAGAKFADAKKAQADAVAKLLAIHAQVQKTLSCALDAETRERLRCCLDDLQENGACDSCEDVDSTECDCFCCDDIAGGTALPAVSEVERCVKAALDAATKLKDLPTTLATDVSSISEKLTTLENQLCTGELAADRGYVQFLLITREVEALRRTMAMSDAAYTSALKAAIDLLVKRYRLLVCVAARWAGERAFADAQEDRAKAQGDQLVDLVLECAAEGEEEPCPEPEPEPCPEPKPCPEPEPEPKPCPEPEPEPKPCPEPEPEPEPCPEPEPTATDRPGRTPNAGP